MSSFFLTALVAASVGHAESLTILDAEKLEKLNSSQYRNIKVDSSVYKVVDASQGVDGNDVVLGQSLKDQKNYAIPFGSVAKSLKDGSQQVLSVAYKADIEERKLELTGNLVQAGETVRLQKETLKDIKKYVLYIDDQALLERLKSKGLDLSMSALRFSMDSEGKLNAVQRCKEQACETSLVFDVVNLNSLDKGNLKVEKKVALNVENKKIFESAIALEEKGMVEDLKHEQAHRDQEKRDRTNQFLQNLNSDVKINFEVSTSGAAVGSVEDVVCSSSGKAAVMSSDLSKVIAQGENGTGLRVVQDFNGSSAPEGFVEVVLDGSNQRGLVAASQLRPRSQCEYVAQKTDSDDSSVQTASFGASGDSVQSQSREEEANLLSAGAKKFPTIKRPSQSYRSGMRAFGSRRGGGSRKHAACDLYRVRNEKTVAVEAGKVIQGPYFFYQGTYAREVKLNSGPVIRYGEITSKKSGAVNGSFKAGDVIGFIGKTHCCTPMLHFEKFAGTKSGSLTAGGAYRRRSDLMNPTQYLQGLEKATFGKSY